MVCPTRRGCSCMLSSSARMNSSLNPLKISACCSSRNATLLVCPCASASFSTTLSASGKLSSTLSRVDRLSARSSQTVSHWTVAVRRRLTPSSASSPKQAPSARQETAPMPSPRCTAQQPRTTTNISSPSSLCWSTTSPGIITRLSEKVSKASRKPWPHPWNMGTAMGLGENGSSIFRCFTATLSKSAQGERCELRSTAKASAERSQTTQSVRATSPDGRCRHIRRPSKMPHQHAQATWPFELETTASSLSPMEATASPW
mmetsp:Transcript_61405/g.179469  ORF Transcript_61405/g.179469 Transcript_61405/m.179469 type:complete len:260 (-) Transcript_61405:465-1244(-)